MNDLRFRRIILKRDNDSLQDAVIGPCVGVEVIHMANGRVDVVVREVKRQCRAFRISAEQNTSVRISDDSPSLSWLPRFAAQVMNKMRFGKDVKTSQMRRTEKTKSETLAGQEKSHLDAGNVDTTSTDSPHDNP